MINEVYLVLDGCVKAYPSELYLTWSRGAVANLTREPIEQKPQEWSSMLRLTAAKIAPVLKLLCVVLPALLELIKQST
ncbi:hypothetical protein [Methanopyrus kandleri]|uniref:Uncharacterized protein n=2 Tax=Methanopyrus kandleri TaxID=2320 RepID=Q8TYI3_METKA|nr:hypothetical protein [Methanopyrus kandleri]AAM01531.1 Uncharacterized protein MK0316 [Methanopyrus kandleri AV19]HII70534.1 hypothetical protein [Methanopyrus kandleri]